MSGHRDRGTDNHMADEPIANEPSKKECTASGSNTTTRYKCLLHRQSASLDLETAFKCVTISSDITPDVCRVCQCDICQCPAFNQGTPCSSASSMPTRDNLDDDIPELVPNIDTKDTTRILYPPEQSPSDEEADREVAAICKAPVFYHMTQKGRRRCRYYFYSPLDNIEESRQGKQKRDDSPPPRGFPEL